MKSIVCLGLLSVLVAATAYPYAGPNPYAAPVPFPNAGPLASPYPEPNCCAPNQFGCGLGLCSCCGGTSCENGACNPIIPYADGFYGPPRVQGGYGQSFGYGR